jgi:hypothetical protein
MDTPPIGLPRDEVIDDGTRELSAEHVRARLQLLESLAAEIAALKRHPDARRRLRMNDPGDAATARAAANIAAWRRYLPEDCISTMIRDEVLT